MTDDELAELLEERAARFDSIKSETHAFAADKDQWLADRSISEYGESNFFNLPKEKQDTLRRLYEQSKDGKLADDLREELYRADIKRADAEHAPELRRLMGPDAQRLSEYAVEQGDGVLKHDPLAEHLKGKAGEHMADDMYSASQYFQGESRASAKRDQFKRSKNAQMARELGEEVSNNPPAELSDAALRNAVDDLKDADYPHVDEFFKVNPSTGQPELVKTPTNIQAILDAWDEVRNGRRVAGHEFMDAELTVP